MSELQENTQMEATKSASRWKSPVLWGAIAAQVLAILVTLGVLDAGQSDTVNAVIAAVLQLLATFGVLNNPTNPNGF